MLTLADIKATILANARSQEICSTLHDTLIAVDETELIDAGIPFIRYAYQAGIVDDTLLANFTEASLNNKGIYTTGTFTLTNPDEIFILKDAVVSITVDDNNKSKINCMGACNVTITSANNSYVTLRCYDSAVVSITANDNSMIDIESRENVALTVIKNSATISQIVCRGNSVTGYTGNDTSFSNSKIFQHAEFSYALNASAAMNIIAYDAAIINAPLPT